MLRCGPSALSPSFLWRVQAWYLSRPMLERKEDAKGSTHRVQCQVPHMFHAVAVLRWLVIKERKVRGNLQD